MFLNKINMDCNYKYFLLTDFASAPTRGSPDAAGYDLKSAYDYIIPKHGKQLVKTDLTFEFPRGCYGRIAPRSGLAVKNAIDVGAGVIDRDYTGNVGVLLFNHSDVDFEVKRGDRIAQLILTVYNDGVLVRGENDTRQTERGNQGFGSTGIRCKTPSSNLVITLEGNIGAGKTTLARALYEELKKLGLKTAHIQEPVGAWKDFHGTNLLDLLYKDIERWAFAFQSNALVYMTDCDRRAVEYSKKGYIVIKERSSFTVRNIFNEKYKAYMTPAEIHILNDLSGTIKDPRVTAVAEGIINDVTLYLKTDPGTCYKRKLQRKRPEEIGKNNMVDEQYLKSLHDIHETALAKPIGKVVVADGTRFDAQDPKSVRISGSGDLVFEALMQIGGIDVDQLNCVFENNDSLIDECTPEGDLITI